MPGRRWRLTAVTALSTMVRSGPPCSDSGVGTQMTTVSVSATARSSVVAVKPWARTPETVASSMSSTCEDAVVEAGDDLGVLVEADDGHAGAVALHGEGQAHVAEAYDDKVTAHNGPFRMGGCGRKGEAAEEGGSVAAGADGEQGDQQGRQDEQRGGQAVAVERGGAGGGQALRTPEASARTTTWPRFMLVCIALVVWPLPVRFAVLEGRAR